MRRRVTLPLIALASSLSACAVTEPRVSDITPPPVAPVASAAADTATAQPIAYPTTRRGDVTDVSFGERITDPYRWLENDVRQDQEVANWVAEQNRVTNAYLATLPTRQAFADRVNALYRYERFSLPLKRGNRYFYTRNDGSQNQSVLYVREGLNGEGRVLIDPNTWAADGATALAEFSVSKDGRYVAYGVQDGGTDWRIVKVLDVNSGQVMSDELRWVKFSGMSWAKDGSGFYYSRFPQPAPGATFQSTNLNQAVYFHRLGTPQAQDRLIYSTPDRPRLGHGAGVSDDGRYLIISTTEGTDPSNALTVIDLTRPNSRPITLVGAIENSWDYVGNDGSKLYLVTDKDAPNKRIVTMDVGANGGTVRPLVPEGRFALQGASRVGNRLFINYLEDARSQVRVTDMSGREVGRIGEGQLASIGGFGGDPEDTETFYAVNSFNSPSVIYRYDLATGQSSEFIKPTLLFNPDDYTVEQRFFASKDGTRVPMFVVQKKGFDRAGGSPTILYGYGGFGSAMTPSFSATNIAWLDAGGVYVLANIRGGSEYGNAWHDAGRRANKQNVFDDFIAAGEYLIREGITGRGELAVRGGSNGGTLVGAVVNQRPDLFAAAIPAVGVMDMLRFDRFTAGRYWVDDYGYPDREADWRVLRAYSPYHNVRGGDGRTYPAVLVTTADTDDRVVPGHSFKYAAALQAEDLGPRPRLIRIESRAGHGSGRPVSKIVDEAADVFAFIAQWTGLDANANLRRGEAVMGQRTTP